MTGPGTSPPALTGLERRVQQASAGRDALVTKQQRRSHGVVHTPPELARHLARAVDGALRTHLAVADGLASPRVRVIDPACGTGAFVAAMLATIGGRDGAPAGVWAADCDASAFAVARDVLAPALATAGVPGELALTDTLACDPARVAAGAELVVVIGNPPWSAAALPRSGGGAASDAMLDDFRRLPDGSPLGERKLGVLSDRYVRFVRWAFAAARAARSAGVVALVTNGSYIDGPVHRGMRAAMAAWSSELQVLDLGGNAMLPRSGRRDDNLFGVRPSVAIMLAVCRREQRCPKAARVRYRRLWGTTAHKLAAVGAWAEGDATGLRRVRPEAPEHAFVPRRARKGRYAEFISLSEALPFHREGVQTNRDGSVVAADREQLLSRLRAFVADADDPALSAARTARGHYDPARAREAVAAVLARDPDGRLGISVLPIAYRHRDRRVFCPVAPFCHRPRPALLSAMARSAWALVSVRKDRGDRPWRHIGAVDVVADSSYLSNRSSCRTRVFPLCAPMGGANLGAALLQAWPAPEGAPLSAGDFARYALAVLSAPAFVSRHDALLRQDYARVPIPTDPDRAQALIAAGDRLLQAQLASSAVVPDAPSPKALDGLLDPAWLT